MTARERIDEYERLSRLKTSGSTARLAPATSDRIDRLRLAMLHLAFPLVIAMAAMDKYRDMVYNFFKLLAGVYMIVPLLYLVNHFGNLTYIALVSKISAQQDFLNPLIPITMSLVMILFVVWVKFRLFKRVFSFTFQIIR